MAVFIVKTQDYRIFDSAGPLFTYSRRSLSSNPLTITERKRIIAILALATFSVVFWMGCSQMGSSVLFFSKNFVHRNLFSVDVPPTVFLSFFALSVVVLGPVLAGLRSSLSQKTSNLALLYRWP